MESRINDRGNKVRTEPCERDAYEIDRFCKSELGWVRYRTDKDGDKFAIWVNMGVKQISILSGCEFRVVECDSLADFGSEMCHLYDLYGESKRLPQKLGGKFPMTTHVTFESKRGIITDKTFDTESGWIYRVCFDDSEEWFEEEDLEPVWRK